MSSAVWATMAKARIERALADFGCTLAELEGVLGRRDGDLQALLDGRRAWIAQAVAVELRPEMDGINRKLLSELRRPKRSQVGDVVDVAPKALPAQIAAAAPFRIKGQQARQRMLNSSNVAEKRSELEALLAEALKRRGQKTQLAKDLARAGAKAYRCHHFSPKAIRSAGSVMIERMIADLRAWFACPLRPVQAPASKPGPKRHWIPTNEELERMSGLVHGACNKLGVNCYGLATHIPTSANRLYELRRMRPGYVSRKSWEDIESVLQRIIA